MFVPSIDERYEKSSLYVQMIGNFCECFMYWECCQNGWLNHVQKQTIIERGTHNAQHTYVLVWCVVHLMFSIFLFVVVPFGILFVENWNTFILYSVLCGVRVLVDKIKTKGVWTVYRILCGQVQNKGFLFSKWFRLWIYYGLTLGSWPSVP